MRVTAAPGSVTKEEVSAVSARREQGQGGGNQWRTFASFSPRKLLELRVQNT